MTGLVRIFRHSDPEFSRSPKQHDAGFWILLVTILGSSLAFIDATAVNVALPTIQIALHADTASLQWVIAGYALFLSSLMLVGGALGDIAGRRFIFLSGIVVFAAASAGCAAATTIFRLDVARCVQGAGAALATPGSLALISANFKGEARGRAIGTWSGFGAITAAAGPLLGGWLTQHASWRDVFIINLPITLIILVASILHVPESRDPSRNRRIDAFGAVLATAALGASALVLSAFEGGKSPPYAAASIGGTLLLWLLFIRWETHTRTPMIPLAVFRNRAFSATNFYTLFLYTALGASLYFVPFNLQNVQGYTPSAAGAAMLPFIVIVFLLSRWSGGLVAKAGARTPLIIGALLEAAGFAAYMRIGIGGSYWTTFFPPSVICGIGGVFFIAPLTTSVMNALQDTLAGLASGINNAVARTANLLAITGLGIVLSAGFYAHFDRSTPTLPISAATRTLLVQDRGLLTSARAPAALISGDRAVVQRAIDDAYLHGFRAAMGAAAVLAFAAALVALFFIPGRPRAGTPEHAADEAQPANVSQRA